MYTLHPSNRLLYSLQASVYFYLIAIRFYWDNLYPEKYDYDFTEQKKAFPLSKREFDNFVSRLLFHDSNSSLVATMNPTSKDSQWIYESIISHSELSNDDIRKGCDSFWVNNAISKCLPKSMELEDSEKAVLNKSLWAAIIELPSTKDIGLVRNSTHDNISDHTCLVLYALRLWTECGFEDKYLDIDSNGNTVTKTGYYLTEVMVRGDTEYTVPFTPEFNSIEQFNEHFEKNAKTYLRYALIDPNCQNWHHIVDEVNALL